MTEEQEDVRDALKRMYGFELTYLESQVLGELLGLEIHVYALHGHPKAVRIYGWAYEQEDGTQYVGVLHLPPIASPLYAALARISEIISGG